MNIPLKVIIHKDRTGLYWAEVPALPGCLTEAETLDEIQANIRDAITAWIEAGNEKAAEPVEDDAAPVEVLEL